MTTQPALNRAFRSDLGKAGLMPKWIYDAIRTTGSQKPRMYGLPKTRKEGTALRPILSMTGSSHHELGKWLAGLLQPVLERFSSHRISDSFTFAKTMQNLDIGPNVFMCSFDVSSLLTNVPFDETSKSAQMPFTTILIYNHSFQGTCLLN